ncbi:MAG: malto-oligosyltrehalose synthase [Steroidobacteraceae bacterium]|nr:malto-oligosyltrehalose synthase [Steroidobacteraceae bacterium]
MAEVAAKLGQPSAVSAAAARPESVSEQPQAEPLATGSSAPRATIPRATYRLQLNGQFTFRDATALVPYLSDLGISHVYCSPYFRARPGSMHGYDVVDHNAINPEIGTREELDQFVAALRAHGMGHILDFVPNHVGVMGAENAWWMDVLENGKASRYAGFFDIDWSPPNPALAGKLLVPVLGEPYGNILEKGELPLRYEAEQGSFAVFYHQHRFPIDPRTYPFVLERVLARCSPGDLNEDQRAEFASLMAAFGKLPERDSSAAEQIVERDRDKELFKRRLAALVTSAQPLSTAMSAVVAELSGTPGDPRSFDSLHELLEQQCYRLAYWRVASDDINYRRFFDVNDLAALRMENPQVFEHTHRLLLELVARRMIDGLRIDHPDGLYDPKHYFEQLQGAVVRALEAQAGSVSANPGTAQNAAPSRPHAEPAEPAHESAAQGTAFARTEGGALPLYLVIEKILAAFERLPQSWPVHGTTGYNFANVINGVFVDARAKPRLDRIYSSFIVDYAEWQDVAFDSKLLVLRTSLAAELNVLANQLARIAQAERHTRDFTLSNLRQVLTEVIASFPVYRTYVTDHASEDDRRYIDWAIVRARRRGSSTDVPLLDFVRTMLMATCSNANAADRQNGNTDVPDERCAQIRAFAGKFQQVTAPVTAKGVEDTALYRFTRLASLNEVGGEPDVFGISPRQFHADAQHRARHWPHEMLATSTHDTKRSEDVRARINVLSEIPLLLRKYIRRWSHMNRARRRIVDDLPAPGPHAEYLLYQTLIGTWPLQPLDDPAYEAYLERIEAYMLKASREAKRRTSWSNINEEYEDALRHFIRFALERREGNLFPQEVADGARRIARFGFLNSLGQTLCKLTAPGVPDIYQGNELWDESLVDPDNRRPVDYALRRRLLDDIMSWPDDPEPLRERLNDALSAIEDGRCKLYVTYRALRFRRQHEALFRDGAYIPLRVTGTRANHLVAYARKHGDDYIVVAFPRLCVRLIGERAAFPLGPDVWSNTRIELPRSLAAAARSSGALRNILEGATVTVSPDTPTPALRATDVFTAFPVALLTSAPAASPS